MRATNYFRVSGGKTYPSDVFPFDDADRDDTVRAWELAAARVKGEVASLAVWREPRCEGAWSGATRRVGHVTGSRGNGARLSPFHPPTVVWEDTAPAPIGAPFVPGPDSD